MIKCMNSSQTAVSFWANINIFLMFKVAAVKIHRFSVVLLHSLKISAYTYLYKEIVILQNVFELRIYFCTLLPNGVVEKPQNE